MKRFLPLFTVNLFVAVAFTVACGGGDKAKLRGDISNFEQEGWLDDNTFQVKAIGEPAKGDRGLRKRRLSAEENALQLAAKTAVKELLAGTKLKIKDKGFDINKLALSSEFKDAVVNGALIRKSFDVEDNCNVTYRMQRMNLKRLVEAEIAALQ